MVERLRDIEHFSPKQQRPQYPYCAEGARVMCEFGVSGCAGAHRVLS